MRHCSNQLCYFHAPVLFELRNAFLNLNMLLLSGRGRVQISKLVLPVPQLLKNLLDLATKVNALSGAIEDAPGPVTLDQSSKHTLTLELFQQASLHHPPKVVPTPDFLNQRCAEGPNLLFELFLSFLACLLEHEYELLNEARLLAAIRD